MSETELATVAALTHEGEGVVRGGKTAFVAGALPGETVRFRRVRRHRQHDEARLIEVVHAAPERTVPRCAHFGVCGGCVLQHLIPERQIELKEAELRESLERIGRVAPQEWLAPLRGPAWAYRRRARLGARFVAKKGRVVVGFRERWTSHVALIERCEVLAAPAGELVGPLASALTALSIRDRIPQIEVAVADNVTALVLRVLTAPSSADLEILRRFESAHGLRLYLQPGGIESVQRLTPGDGEPLSYGLGQFGVRLEFEPTDFVQVNGAVNQALVARAVELLEPDPTSRVLDLYCGIGNFSLALARQAARVVGVEGEAGLVQRARHNATINGLGNVEFEAADLGQPPPPSSGWARERFSHVLLDPPRAGARDVMPTIARLEPERLLYISCHPGSLARDLGMLVHDFGFALCAAGVLDMFPHTTHVESLALLTPPEGARGGKTR